MLEPNLTPEPLTWKNMKPKVGPVYYRGYLGKVPVVAIQWSGHHAEGTYSITFFLPGIQSPQSADEVSAAQFIANSEVSAWIDSAGLEIPDEG